MKLTKCQKTPQTAYFKTKLPTSYRHFNTYQLLLKERRTIDFTLLENMFFWKSFKIHSLIPGCDVLWESFHFSLFLPLPSPPVSALFWVLQAAQQGMPSSLLCSSAWIISQKISFILWLLFPPSLLQEPKTLCMPGSIHSLEVSLGDWKRCWWTTMRRMHM